MRTVIVSLFAGIGGFDLAAQELGWESAVICEIADWCQVVLRHKFPHAYIHGDINTLTGEKINEEIEKRFGPRKSLRVVACGGFPCQPWSSAGKRLGKEDARHLWPEMLRVIQECRPDAVVGENVSGILSWNGGLVFEEVQADLEAQGFEVQSVVVPACAVGAPHRRDRVWFVANRNPADGYPNLERVNEKQGKEILGKEQSSHATGDGEQNEWSLANARLPEPQGREETEERQQHVAGRITRNEPSPLGGLRHAPHATVEGLEGCIGEELQGRGKRLAEHGEEFDERDAPHAECLGRQGSGWAEGSGNTEANGNWKASWADPNGGWPTEWPIRIGNDGLSARLGGISLPSIGRVTESKLNKETLKMAGNAIVPQVALQIFRALQETWA